MIPVENGRAGIVASVGRTLCSEAALRDAVTAGAYCFRLALGLRDRDPVEDFQRVRAAASEVGHAAQVLLDLPASRPRVGRMTPRTFKAGDTVWVVDAEDVAPGDVGGIPVPGITGYVDALQPGHRLVFRDGRQTFRITTVNEGRVELECLACHEALQPYNGCSFPDSAAAFMPATAEDKEILSDMAQAGLQPDWIAISLVTAAAQIAEVRQMVEEFWPQGGVRMMAKLETPHAVESAGEILGAADGCLLGRGDLGIAMPPERLPLAQATVVQEAQNAGKTFVVATQILEHFASTGTIYRAELNDVAMAVRQGAQGLVLCQETSDSAYPIETIDLARRLIVEESRALASGKE